jgi:hypothetical protein
VRTLPEHEASIEKSTGSCIPLSRHDVDLVLLRKIFERVVTERTVHLVTILDSTGGRMSRLIEAFVGDLDDSALVLEAAHSGIADRSFETLLTGDRPLVILVEDLRLAEQPVADAVALVAERMQGTPSLVIGRAEMERPEVSWIGRSPNATIMELSPS